MEEQILDRLRQLRQAAEDRGLANVREVRNHADFRRHLDAAGNSLIVVDFSTDWCPPSLMMEPLLADLSEKYPGVVFLKVDAEVCTQTADLYQIDAYPTFVFLKEKKQLQQLDRAAPTILESCILGLSEFPDSRITTRALQHLELAHNVSIKDEIGPVWLDIAMCIRMDTKVISAIASQFTEPEECSQALLEVWLDPEEGVPRPPTWRVLLEALRLSRKVELAIKIEQCRESNPDVFHEISKYLSKEALKQMYEQDLKKKGREIQTCARRGLELEKVIEQKDREIASLKKQLSQLESLVPITIREDAASPGSGAQGCDLPGMEPIGSTVYVVSGNKPHVFKWAGYGIRVRIPKGAVAPNLPPTELQITASLTGQYEFPEGHELVSGVYCISFPLEFSQPATLDIQHCLALTRSCQCSSLTFVVAKCSQRKPPYKFELVEGGIFSPRSPYGSLKITQFSLWAILRSRSKKKDGNDSTTVTQDSAPSVAAPAEPTPINYSAQLFYLQNRGIYSWMLHFVIIPNLEISRTAIQQKYAAAQKGADDIPVTYEDDRIILDIPMDGVMKGSWSLVPMGYPMITREDANAYNPPTLAIPKCLIRIKWMNCEQRPEELIYLVHLKGAKEPRDHINIMFEPDEQVSGPPPDSHTAASTQHQPHHELHPLPAQCRDPGKPSLPALMEHVAANVPDKWRIIGIQLGLKQADLCVIHERSNRDTISCFTEVFTMWEKQMSPPYTWKTIIDVLQTSVVGELRVANNIRYNLNVMNSL